MKCKRQNVIGLFCDVLAWGICLAYLTLCFTEIYLFWLKTGKLFELNRLFANAFLLITVVTLFASTEDRVWAVPSSIFVTGWLYPFYGCLRQQFDSGLLVDTFFHWGIALIVYVLFRYVQKVDQHIDNEEILEAEEGQAIEV